MRFADLLPVSDVRDEDAGANNIFHAGPSLLQSRLDVLQRLHRLRVGIANADHLSIRRCRGRPGYMNLCTHAYCARVTHNRDRKSTRLNSSHQIISYAVFCLKKKKKKKKNKKNKKKTKK